MIVEFVKKFFSQTFLESNTGVFIACGAVLATLLYNIAQKYNRPPPELAHLPYISLFTFLRYGFNDTLFDEYAKRYILPSLKSESSGIYVAPTIQRWVIRLADPTVIKQFIMKQEHKFPKAEANTGEKGSLINRFLGGPNILVLSGADWRKHRKIANLAFQRSMPVNIFGQLTNKMLKTMEKDIEESIDVNDLFRRFTLDSIGIAGFGFDFHAIEDKESEWVKYYNSVMHGMAQAFFIVFPIFDTKYVHWFSKRKQLHDYLSKLLENMDVMIEKKRKSVFEKAGPDEEKDLLTLMIESEMKGEGEGLSDEELRSDLCLFFLAGHDTTASSLAAAVYELARNTEIQNKAREEAIRILGEGSDEDIPTSDQLKEIVYINMVIKETLRRHSPAYVTTDRVSQEDIVLGNVHIPKGSELGIDMYALHHNPAVWSDPYVFDPERFKAGGEADGLSSLAWAPFSSGGRHCVGMNFSLVEQRVALIMLLRKYTWTLPKDVCHQNGLEKRGIAWGMAVYKDNIKIKFKRR